MKKKAEILLVDDNPADIELTRDTLKNNSESRHIEAAKDGVEAIAFLRQRVESPDAGIPDLMFLDLNMPRKDGRAVLAEVKNDPRLRTIPIVVFTASRAHPDISKSYELGANCYVTKPATLPEFMAAVKSIEEFWLTAASLPQAEEA
jgi:two-component system, chemotaxis family, response regulator Rcp1